MAIRWLFATLHLLALGIGLGAVWARGWALQAELDTAGLQRVFYADNWWGIAALVWLATGLARAFAGLEKGTAYYLNNHVFWTKMGLFLLISPGVVADAYPDTVASSGATRRAAGDPGGPPVCPSERHSKPAWWYL